MSWETGLQPWLRPWALHLVRQLRGQVTVTSVYRSWTEQLRLYQQRGRRYPVLPPGQSMHQYGRAWDMVGPDDVLEAAGRAWQSWGGRWGGASDPIHFEA